MVIVRTDDNVFVLQLLVFSREDGDDVMAGFLCFFPEGKVLIEALFPLSLDNALEPEAAQFAGQKVRSEGVAGRRRESTAKFL